METLSINTPSDLISFVHHALGFRPRESLVCVTLTRNQVGATLRIDLPAENTQPGPCARKTTECLSNGPEATSAVFLLYTTTPRQRGAAKPFHSLVRALSTELAGENIHLADGWLVTDTTFTPYPVNNPHLHLPETPLNNTETCQLNAELIYRGSQVLPRPAVLPPTAPTGEIYTAVQRTMDMFRMQPRHQLLTGARTLWNELLDHGNYPLDEQTTELLAYFQIPEVRDRLIADMPDINEPPLQILLAQTHASPHWERVDWAEQLLIHLYTHDPTEHSAPVLTAISLLSWWEGKGSKSLQFTQLALALNPKFTPAHLIQQMLQVGLIAPWAKTRQQAHRAL